MNRKVESLAQLAEVSMAKARSDFDAAASLARSLENATFDERDTLSLDEWGRYRDLAERILAQRHEFLRAIGELRPLPPPKPGMFDGGVRKADAPAGREERTGRRRARMAGTDRSRRQRKKVDAAPAEAARE